MAGFLRYLMEWMRRGLMDRRGSFFVGIFVVLCSLSVAACLAVATKDMTCIPTDAEALYLPAARSIIHQPYIASLHRLNEKSALLYGKEVLIAHCAFAQRMLNDVETMRPLTLVCITAFFLSSVLIFFIARRYWGMLAGLLVYGLFLTSFWPYVYVLMIKHQPLGLCYFVLAVFFVQRSGRGVAGFLMVVLSSLCMSASLLSSTNSAVLVPFYATAFFYNGIVVVRLRSIRAWAVRIGAGVIGVVLFMTWLLLPDFAGNFRDYWQGYSTYLHSNSTIHWAYYFQNVLREWMEHPESARGGWLWVWRYFWLIMPMLFPVYLGCAGWLAWRAVSGRESGAGRLAVFGMILLSFSPVLLAEIKGVGQYGANYFFSFIGILMLLGYAVSVWGKDAVGMAKARVRAVGIVLAGAAAIHVLVNGYIFFSDVFPTRMTTVTLSRELERRGIRELSVYYYNYMTQKMAGQLIPRVKEKIQWRYVDNIYQARQGYILVPPLVVSSVYINMLSPNTDFDQDIYLNALLYRGQLKDYAVCSFDTMATSRIWRQEDDLVSYRDLVLRHFFDDYRRKSRVWVLDAAKLYADRLKNPPDELDVFMIVQGVRNIGTVSTDYRYAGVFARIGAATGLETVSVRLFKVGAPEDSLAAYIYRKEKLWNGEAYMPVEGGVSASVRAEDITADPNGGDVTFRFGRQIMLTPGEYHIVIYRSGAPGDRDFYRVYVDQDERDFFIRAIQVADDPADGNAKK